MKNAQACHKRACVVRGIGRLRFHGLQHSATRKMIDSDIDLYTVGKRMANNANEASGCRAF
jgi:hypothetical protein